MIRRALSSGAVTFLLVWFAAGAMAADFKTVDGKEYKNVKVSRVEPDGIVLITNSGIWKLYFTELPKDVQERYHYDPAQAASYSATQAATQAAFQKQQADLQHKLAEERTRVQAAQEQIRNQQAVAANRGQAVAVISHGSAVDITRHLALGNVTIVDFYADWCGPCKKISPSLEQLANSDPEVALRKIDIVNWNTPVVNQYKIHSIPHVNVYDRGGNLVGSVAGADFEEIRRYVAVAKRSG